MNDEYRALLNVILAGMLAAVPGLDRELRRRPAGLRTYMIVGMGSALITSMARIVFSGDASSRLVANIITGIGFLGAGVILRRNDEVHDLTTAAGIWIVAMVGIVVAYELYVLSIGATLILGVVMTGLRLVEDRILSTRDEPTDV